MAEYQTITFISIFMLSLVYLTGLGADQIVDFNQQSQINISETESEVNLRTADPSFVYTYYSTSENGVVVNATNFTNNAGFFEVPDVTYPATESLEGRADIRIEVDYPMNKTNFTLYENAISYCQGINCAPIPYEGYQTEYEGETPRVLWQSSNGDNNLNEGIVLKQITFITDSTEIDRNFLESLSALVRVTTGYDYFNDVIITTFLFVLTAVVITLGARGLPFF